MIGYRHCDSRFPFLWSHSAQPSARWHGAGEGPANYFADTPVGAWAEFLRHEEIRTASDLDGVRRSLWAVELPDADYAKPSLSVGELRGGKSTYGACQAEARRLRAAGAQRLGAESAALVGSGASGWVVDPDITPSPTSRDGRVFVMYGLQPALVGWPAVEGGAPPERVLNLVNHF
jgi:hypothetical protein